MRSEKDQMAVDTEKSVEIQFRDIPREQESPGCHLKQKEEKKEVFSKVSEAAFWYAPYCLLLMKTTDMEEVADHFSTEDSEKDCKCTIFNHFHYV